MCVLVSVSVFLSPSLPLPLSPSVSLYSQILSKVDSACPKDLTKYAVCLDKNSNKYEECRKEQAALQACAGTP